MDLLSSKWFLGLGLLILILLLLYFTGKKSVESEIQISSTKENVWKVLTDISMIKEWNKVLVPVEGDFAKGAKIKYQFYQDENGEAAFIMATVAEFKEAELINQRGGIPGILTFNHQYILEEKGELTQVRIREEYRGIMVNFWNPEPVEKAYGRLLISLKERIED